MNPVSLSYLLGILLGLFTFLAELVILRHMSTFWGSGIKATGFILFLFILGIGIGDLLTLLKLRRDTLILIVGSLSLVILALLPLFIYSIPSHKIAFSFCFSLFVAAPGIISGYFYTRLIQDLRHQATIIFILVNTLGSLTGCLLSYVLLNVIGISELLIILSFFLIAFLFRQKILFWGTLSIASVMSFVLFYSGQHVSPAVYHQLLEERKSITYPIESLYNSIADQDLIFNKASQYGAVMVDNQYRLYVNNVLMCGKDLNEEIINPEIVSHMNLNDKKVLIIGLGCGATLEEYLAQNKQQDLRVTVLEINPVVLEAQKLFYESDNPVDDQRVNMITGDGYNYLLDSSDDFDTIIVDSSDPVSLESSKLYTVDFNRLIFSHLTDDGYIVWRTVITNSDFDRVCYSNIRSVFPSVMLRKIDYAVFYFGTKKPFFFELTQEEADLLNYFESQPFIINSIDHPVIK